MKKRNIPSSLTTVTPFSKYLALFLLITLPVSGFFLGMEYQKQLQLLRTKIEPANLISPKSPDDLTSWKVYISPESNFEFKYPPDNQFQLLANNTLEITSPPQLCQRQNNREFVSDYRITLVPHVGIMLKTTQEFWDSKNFIDGKPAYNYSQKTQNDFINTSYWLEVDRDTNSYLEVNTYQPAVGYTCLGYHPNPERINQTIKQILSTFKFTNSNNDQSAILNEILLQYSQRKWDVLPLFDSQFGKANQLLAQALDKWTKKANLINEIQKEKVIQENMLLADSPEVRANFEAATKLCVAEGFAKDDLVNILKYCNRNDDPLMDQNFNGNDDITATAEILPYVIKGVALFDAKQFTQSKKYLNSINTHYDKYLNQWGKPNGTSLGYQELVDISQKLLNNIP